MKTKALSVNKISEMSYAIFLLLNSAVNRKRCFQPKDYEYDLTPIGESIKYIAEHVFGVVQLPLGGNVGTYHFLRKQTMSSSVAKTLTPYYRSEYNRKEQRRLVWFDFPTVYTSDEYLSDLDEGLGGDKFLTHCKHYKKLLYKISCIGDVKLVPFLVELRKLLPHFMVSSTLKPHELRMFYGNNEYTDQYMFILYAIDELLKEYGYKKK